MNRARWLTIGLTLALLATACAPSGSDADAVAPAAATGSSPVDQIASTAIEDVPSALDDPNDDAFPAPLIDPDEIRAGGPPPDGIPPIDEPQFLAVDEVDFLADNEPVLALELGGEARAYPLQVMIWHEIVNDTVAGIPVSVTYCPLCNSAIAYDRRLDERVLDFGTSGQLYQSALVMFDRQTESLWSHFTGEAVIGFLTGSQLDVLPVSTVSWSQFRAAHPDSLVLSRETGFSRDYGTNPYPGYDDVDTAPFLFDGEVDGRLAAKQRVIGIDVDDDPVAVRLDRLTADRVRIVGIGGRRVVVWVTEGTTSALDDASVAGGRDVGSTGVFLAAAGQELDFRPDGDHFVDEQTGSRWNVLGRAVDGPLRGEALEPIAHVDTFWFAWGAFQPASRIID